MTQAQYAATLGISDRTLRVWISRWVPAYRASPAVVREVVVEAIERLQDVLVGLGTARGDGDAGPAQRAPTAPAAPPPPATRPVRPQGHPGLDWDMGNIGGQ
jgi:hypothetical protein